MSPLHGIVNFCLNIMNSLTGEVKQGCILSLLLKKRTEKETHPRVVVVIAGDGCQKPIYWCSINAAAQPLHRIHACTHTRGMLACKIPSCGGQISPRLRHTEDEWARRASLPEGSADPAQLDGVVEQQWSKHHFSDEFSCSFVWLCMTRELQAKPCCSRRDLMVPVSLWRINRADKLIGWQISF